MPIYTQAEPKDEAVKLVDKAMKKWHPMLAAEDLTVGVLWVSPGENDDIDDAILKHNGYAAAAVVKITSYKLRVQGLPDATIWIDENDWRKRSAKERLAIIDHELTHLELVTDTYGLTKRDDCGRPKLKMRLHDWQLGGFREVVNRHGDDAIEKQSFARVAAYDRQLLLDLDESKDESEAA